MISANGIVGEDEKKEDAMEGAENLVYLKKFQANSNMTEFTKRVMKIIEYHAN